MKKIHIMAGDFSTPEELQEYLGDVFSFPNHYGANLDALYDCLTEVDEKTKIIISNKIAEEDSLGEYGERLLEVFETAAQDNEKLKLEITE